MKNQKGYTAIGLIYAIIIVVIGIGWVLNILDLLEYTIETIQIDIAVFIIRVIGIFIAPLGAVMGYFV